jgi:regulator of nucleoside diphosphate kinase
MKTPPITITTRDLQRLSQLITSHETSATEQLDIELARAEVVSEREVASDVVTMNSDVLYEDSTTGAQRQIRIVYPKDADADRGWVSILAPLGSALLGLRVGQTIDWQVPNGTRHLRVLGVPYQPEANGDFTL